eukprot:GEMP01094797.1.p1 GENE.GEMP01094797.1~~GEMP01094797.1.p1  ORF type:complete len:184 (+),score=20.42 GEMP01094797.1:133-684(+)
MMFSMWPDTPPSAYALKMRPYAMAVVLLQFVLLPGRFLEIWGGIMFLVVCGLGYAVVWGQPPMAPRWVALWGPICFMNSILDTMFGVIKLGVLYRKHSLTPDQDNPTNDRNGSASLGNLPVWVVWWVCITLILVPIAEGLGAFVSYKLYKDFSPLEDSNGNFGQQFLPPGGEWFLLPVFPNKK